MTDEEALIAASKLGDSAALDALVRAHQDRVYAFAMRMCRNVEDAKDLLTRGGVPLRRCGGAT
jgi:DNA-directed RNA polymerase specialized sigma24 family protein